MQKMTTCITIAAFVVFTTWIVPSETYAGRKPEVNETQMSIGIIFLGVMSALCIVAIVAVMADKATSKSTETNSELHMVKTRYPLKAQPFSRYSLPDGRLMQPAIAAKRLATHSVDINNSLGQSFFTDWSLAKRGGSKISNFHSYGRKEVHSSLENNPACFWHWRRKRFVAKLHYINGLKNISF